MIANFLSCLLFFNLMFYFGRNVEFKTVHAAVPVIDEVEEEATPQENEESTDEPSTETNTTSTTTEPVVRTMVGTNALAVIAEEPEVTTTSPTRLALPVSPRRRPRNITPPAPPLGIGSPITPRNARSPGFRSPRSPEYQSGF